MEAPSQETSTTSIGDIATTSCERCRRRKIKCDRRQPCSKCRKAGTECARAGSGEKQRPVPKSYVQALEGQVASLELFIQRLASVPAERRDEMLADFHPVAGIRPATSSSRDKAADDASPESGSHGQAGATLARSRAGQMRKGTSGNAPQFYGGTSLFQIHLAVDSSLTLDPEPETLDSTSSTLVDLPGLGQSPDAYGLSPRNDSFLYAPHDDVSQRLMATFFKQQYQYNMCVYREYFLRDYDTGTGRYYSDLLLYAICAMGALATDDSADLPLSDVFASQAQSLLYSSLDSPDLTALQALILLGQREIGQCRPSKGWLFCGMAFRLAHEMGLHLDPNNWRGTSEPDIDREVFRRVYWAAFVADKQLSLYFGRPPALYPHESDVRTTVRIPYPPDWQGLLDTYIAPGLSATAYEDGIALVGAFIYQAELSKIQHSIITDLFENRRPTTDNAAIAAIVQQIHVSLTKWLAGLPGKLYWNQWTVGRVPSCVLHLHMCFHTAMIILHRPPRHLFSEPDIAASEDVEICYESLQAIFRLMRSYSRFYQYSCMPLDFVHTLSVAASTVLMKRHLDQTPWDDVETSRSLNLILEAIQAIKAAWPCVGEIEKGVVRASQEQPSSASSVPEVNTEMDLGFLAEWANASTTNAGQTWPTVEGFDNSLFDIDSGLTMTNEELADIFSSNPDY